MCPSDAKQNVKTDSLEEIVDMIEEVLVFVQLRAKPTKQVTEQLFQQNTMVFFYVSWRLLKI